MVELQCRLCAAPLGESFADLGHSPPSNAFVDPARTGVPDRCFPLHARVCSACRLVQLPEFEAPGAIFSDYAYFSSFSPSWLRHAEAFAAAAAERLPQGGEVIEIASNDGYLLQYFLARGLRVLGIEPAANVGAVARDRGIPTRTAFFGRAAAAALITEGHRPDLVVANNVLAHVPELNDFVAGLQLLLAPEGVLSIEVPHLLHLMRADASSTRSTTSISPTSRLHVVPSAFSPGMGCVCSTSSELSTHGGSLRVFACHAASTTHAETAAVVAILRSLSWTAGLEGADSL